MLQFLSCCFPLPRPDMQLNCMMGFFPEIERAWLTIDSDIFVWTYEYGGDLAYFDGLGEAILGVGLVKPKPGIFQPHIRFLLCLTTPVEIVLLGVSFSRSPDETLSDFAHVEMHLLPEPLFSIPSDNSYMLTVSGTDTGRIFLGSKDGCLYELAYQAEDGWFSRKCRKINHSQSSLSFLVPSFISYAFSEEDPILQIAVDNTRNILYTRSEKGTLQVFDLGSNGLGMVRVSSISQSSVAQLASSIARTIDRSNFHPIVHISAVEFSESLHIHLVAITQAGVRLYFTTTSLSNPQSNPSTLQLLHVRLPPGYTASSPPQRPNKVHIAHYRRGMLLLASSRTEDSDILWSLSNDAFPFQQQLIETQHISQMGGRTWALAEIPRAKYAASAISHGAFAVEPPFVVTQHCELPRRFVLLSPQGSHIITKPRPVDQLCQLLLTKGPESEAVKGYFCLQKEDQACAACLILACSPSPLEPRVPELATKAFFLHGGDPQFRSPSTSSQPGGQFLQSPSTSAWISSPRSGSPPGKHSMMSQSAVGSNFYPPLASTPVATTGSSMMAQQSPSPTLQNLFGSLSAGPLSQAVHPLSRQMLGMPSTGSELHYSGRHDGLYLYFGRIVRALWEERMAIDAPCQTSKGFMHYFGSAVTTWELVRIIEQLKNLQTFLTKNGAIVTPLMMENMNASQQVPHLVQSSGMFSDSQPQQMQRRLQVDAQMQEKISLLGLQQLISKTVEALGLWRVLCDHQFHIITRSLPKDTHNLLRVVTLKELVLNGKELSAFLVSSLINHYLGDNSTIDAISSRLREICPSIYKTEDSLFSKANELFLQSQRVQNQHEKEELIVEALRLCKLILPNVNLAVVCGHLQAANHYSGVVDICLSAAARRDPQNIALDYYRNGEKPEDQSGLQAYMARMECYKFILLMLTELMLSSRLHPQSSNIPKSPGPPPPPDPNFLTPREVQEQAERVFQLCLKSDDELFHTALYSWLAEKQMSDRLLEIKSPFIESHLKRIGDFMSSTLSEFDLLWRYYEKNNNYSAAAKILSKLAERHCTDINLQLRIEYLARAILCMKSMEARMGLKNEGQFLHELEEKMEVARIQLQILEALSVPPCEAVSEAISRLNSDLMDLTQLYEEFATPFRLFESQLAIIHCAGLYDPALVESLWKSIIDIEFHKVTDRPTDVVVNTLSNKIKALGRIYSTSQKYFPLAFIIRHLELNSAVQSLDPKWVFTIMQAVGIPTTQLVEVYHKLYKARESCWPAIKKSLHLLGVISYLLESYASFPSSINPQERRHLTSSCLDLVAGYLVDLQALDVTDRKVGPLVERFKATQAKLERLT